MFLAAAILVSCSKSSGPPLFLDRPPELPITVGETPLQVVTEDYQWEGRDGTLRRDTPSPLVFAENNLKPVRVPPGSVAKLSLVLPPTEGTLVAQQWRPDFTRKPAEPIEEEPLVLPEEPGIHTFTISAQWPQGKVSYAFQVQVR